MKRLFMTLALSCAMFCAFADEGMWLPQLLGQQVYNDMVKRGLKLTKEQLYSINKSSIKDAIIIFGRGCTGEIVSNEGLIFTNHHCGYDAIATASSVDHNYLHDGFYAKTKQEEIPTNLTVQFLNRIEDVTKMVEDSVQGLTWNERMKAQPKILENIATKMTEGTGFNGRVFSCFNDNQFLLYVFETYKDIRFVGTPPESIGKYGGDTDNWEWPRHTGDFSVFRVYANAEGKPAAFSKDNMPLKPKYFLPISLKPLKDGDYTMIFGYPGGTTRYESSYGVKLKTDINNPTLVQLRDERLKLMFAEMVKDPATKLKLASSYAGIANYWKFFDGESKQLIKFKTYEQKQKEEAAFVAWAKGKPAYENVFSDWEKVYATWRPFAKHRVYMIEGINGSPLAALANRFMALEKLMQGNGRAAEIKKMIESLAAARTAFKESEDVTSDKNIMATTCMMFYNNVDENQQPTEFYTDIKNRFGNLKELATYKTFAAFVFANTMLLDDNKWKAFVNDPGLLTLQADPAFAYVSAFATNFNGKYQQVYDNFNNKNKELGRLYLKGIMEMNPTKAAKMYPDANGSMRVSFGNVKSYRPRDAVFYDYVCTLKGVMEKYQPGNYEFDLPKELIAAYNAKNFGQYKDPKYNDIVVSFITTNDITGGNSGSPVMNAKGELIGLAFDGNYEALSHKIAFDKDLNRTICVDVRYVLWCIDKLGGGSNLIKELKLMK